VAKQGSININPFTPLMNKCELKHAIFQSSSGERNLSVKKLRIADSFRTTTENINLKCVAKRAIKRSSFSLNLYTLDTLKITITQQFMRVNVRSD